MCMTQSITWLQIALFMRTFIFSAHEGARLMKANLEHDHYQAGAMISSHDDPKRFWQSVTVSVTSCLYAEGGSAPEAGCVYANSLSFQIAVPVCWSIATH